MLLSSSFCGFQGSATLGGGAGGGAPCVRTGLQALGHLPPSSHRAVVRAHGSFRGRRRAVAGGPPHDAVGVGLAMYQTRSPRRSRNQLIAMARLRPGRGTRRFPAEPDPVVVSPLLPACLPALRPQRPVGRSGSQSRPPTCGAISPPVCVPQQPARAWDQPSSAASCPTPSTWTSC